MAAVRWREPQLGQGHVELEERVDGSILVRNVEPLSAYPARVTDRLVEWAARTPDRSFMARRVAGGPWRHLSFAGTLEAAGRIGQALLDRGLSESRPLIILSENDLEHAQLAAAALHVGVPYAAVSPPYSLVSKDFAKLRHIVALLTPGLVYASDAARYGPAIAAAVPPEVEVAVGTGTLDTHRCTSFQALADTSATAAVEAAHEAVGPDTIAKFLFTSGSTQAPKGVVNTHRMMNSNQQVIRQAFPFLADEPPVMVDWLPWNHTFGGNHNVGIALYNGGTLYIDDGKPVPGPMQETLRNLREISPTIYFNVPRGFEEIAHALADDAALRDRFFARLRLMFYAGAGLPRPVAESLYATCEAHCGERVGIFTGLGMTETAPWAVGAVRVGELQTAIGRPAPGVTMKLVPSDGKYEVRYRGPGVTPGYWRAPALTAEAFDDEGFFRSGDAVRFVDRTRPELGFAFDGRTAENFKLVSGTWVAVGVLRAQALAEGSPCVQDVVVTGHDRDDVGLLVFPRLDGCRGLAGLPAGATPAQVLAAAPVREFFQAFIDRLHAQGTGSASRVARILLVAEPPSIDRGEVTDKGSLNQRLVLAHRAADVEALHADAPGVIRARSASSAHSAQSAQSAQPAQSAEATPTAPPADTTNRPTGSPA